MSTTGYVLVRLVSMLPTLLGVVVLTFFLSHGIEGDPARMMAGDAADPAVLERIREQFKLDEPLPVQLGAYIANLARGNLGISFQSRQPVLESIADRLPATAELTLFSLVFALVAAVPLGVLSAVRRNRPVDHLVRVFSVVGAAMPAFWSGLMLIWLFYGRLHWLPAGGRLDVQAMAPPHLTGLYTVDSLIAGEWRTFGSSLKHLLLPTFVLGYAYMALLARMVRSSMLEVLAQDYVRIARAKGLTESTVVFRHALRNALMPVTTLAGLAFASLLGGAVLTETIFAWPGVGKFVVDATLALDYPVIMGFTLVIALIYMAVNLAVDLLYGWLNPQIG